MNLQVISKEIHSSLYFQSTGGFTFAASNMLAGLVLEELAAAQKSLTIAFVQQEETYLPVALLGLSQGKNAYVNAQGQWQPSTYTPAVFRTYPFQMAYNEDKQPILCIDADSGYINNQQGERFFTERGEASERLQQTLTVLNAIEHNRQHTQQALAALAEQDLFEVWPLTVQTDTGEIKLDGIYRINEQKLTQLEGDALAKLMPTGALIAAYAHLFSLQNLQSLVALVQQQQKPTAPALPVTRTGELDLEFLNNMDSLNFSRFM